jgi:hypothetical protein
VNQILCNVTALFATLPCPWCFCGGWAIDLFLGRQTRPHKDVDVAVLRRDQLLCRSHLQGQGWHLEVAADGGFLPWPDGVALESPLHAVWCKHDGFDPPFVEVLLNEVDGGRFVFRRNRSITLPLDRAFLRSADGLPFLAPEVVLLYKSSRAQQYEADFQAALPALGRLSRAWLKDSLGMLRPDHPWLESLGP